MRRLELFRKIRLFCEEGGLLSGFSTEEKSELERLLKKIH